MRGPTPTQQRRQLDPVGLQLKICELLQRSIELNEDQFSRVHDILVGLNESVRILNEKLESKTRGF